MAEAEGGRRPLASRHTGWAKALAAWLARGRVTPNAISVAGVLFSAMGATAIFQAPRYPLLFLLGAAAVQLRLLCNLLDGMVAVEGGKASATGALFNEIPDRVADSLLVIAFGFAAGHPWLGFTGAVLAVGTAYLRAFGASLGLGHDFSGPMAKQQRMALLTGGCVLAAVELIVNGTLYSAEVVLALIVAGTGWTCVRRTQRMARLLGERAP